MTMFFGPGPRERLVEHRGENPDRGPAWYLLAEDVLGALRAGDAFAITVVAILDQTRWGTVPDTSWLITVCERMLAGDRLYIDLHETNPPFSIWLYMPPVVLAQALGIAPEILVHAWTYLAVLVGLGLSAWIVRRARFEEADAIVAMAPVIYALLVLFPGNVFTQREHIGMALFLPMMALMAWRLRSDCDRGRLFRSAWRPAYAAACFCW